MSQDTGMIGKIELSLDANSSSFYSNNTSAARSNLSNSRYLMGTKKKISNGNQGLYVEKVIPTVMKSIESSAFQVG